MKTARLMTILIPILAFMGLEVLSMESSWFYYVLIFCNLVIFSLYFFTRNAKTDKFWLTALVLPFLLLNSSILYSSILTNNFLIQLLYLFFLGALFVYLRNLYIYFFKPLKYKAQSLENINFLISFVVVFYSVSGILGLKNFIDLNLWQIMIPIVIILFFTLFQLFWLHRIKFRNNIIFSIILTLTISEIVYISTFLPHVYSIIGLIIAIVFYASTGLSLLYLSYKLSKIQVKTYLSLSIISLLLIFLSSRWI
ncbi:hypothetical protein K9M50_03225 [Patescibacteria group bacterium]|nr:hypothetical protein [Patescibacteria group bacterium]